jgi:hypothetical protein
MLEDVGRPYLEPIQDGCEQHEAAGDHHHPAAW